MSAENNNKKEREIVRERGERAKRFIWCMKKKGEKKRPPQKPQRQNLFLVGLPLVSPQFSPHAQTDVLLPLFLPLLFPCFVYIRAASLWSRPQPAAGRSPLLRVCPLRFFSWCQKKKSLWTSWGLNYHGVTKVGRDLEDHRVQPVNWLLEALFCASEGSGHSDLSSSSSSSSIISELIQFFFVSRKRGKKKRRRMNKRFYFFFALLFSWVAENFLPPPPPKLSFDIVHSQKYLCKWCNKAKRQ